MIGPLDGLSGPLSGGLGAGRGAPPPEPLTLTLAGCAIQVAQVADGSRHVIATHPLGWRFVIPLDRLGAAAVARELAQAARP